MAIAALIGGYHRCAARKETTSRPAATWLPTRARPEAGEASIHRIPVIRLVRMHAGRAHMAGRARGC